MIDSRTSPPGLNVIKELARLTDSPSFVPLIAELEILVIGS